jgi:hypothetical protein
MVINKKRWFSVQCRDMVIQSKDVKLNYPVFLSDLFTSDHRATPTQVWCHPHVRCNALWAQSPKWFLHFMRLAISVLTSPIPSTPRCTEGSFLGIQYCSSSRVEWRKLLLQLLTFQAFCSDNPHSTAVQSAHTGSRPSS